MVQKVLEIHTPMGVFFFRCYNSRMKILFKKWDFWYWIVVIVGLWLSIEGNLANSPSGILFGHSTTFSTLGALFIYGPIILFAYIVLKVIEKITQKIITEQEKGKYVTLLIIAIIVVILIGYQGFRLYLG